MNLILLAVASFYKLGVGSEHLYILAPLEHVLFEAFEEDI